MSFRRVFIPVALALTLLLQFVPGTIFAPRPVAAASTSYDFITNACSATWSSSGGPMSCPGIVASPQLENGSVDANPGLVVNPQQVEGIFRESTRLTRFRQATISKASSTVHTMLPTATSISG